MDWYSTNLPSFGKKIYIGCAWSIHVWEVWRDMKFCEFRSWKKVYIWNTLHIPLSPAHSSTSHPFQALHVAAQSNILRHPHAHFSKAPHAASPLKLSHIPASWCSTWPHVKAQPLTLADSFVHFSATYLIDLVPSPSPVFRALCSSTLCTVQC